MPFHRFRSAGRFRNSIFEPQARARRVCCHGPGQKRVHAAAFPGIDQPVRRLHVEHDAVDDPAEPGRWFGAELKLVAEGICQCAPDLFYRVRIHVFEMEIAFHPVT